MKVVIESFGINAADDYFKDVSRNILDDLKLKESKPGGLTQEVELTFQCRSQVGISSPTDIGLVTVYHSEIKTEDEDRFLSAVELSILKMGRRCFFCSIELLRAG